MNFSIAHLIPSEFHDESRVWIYQCDRLFSLGEALDIELMMEEFVKEWKSHGDPVNGFATLFFGQFIVIMADEKEIGVSGCSTDSSVRLIRQIEEKFRVNLFNRQMLAFVNKDKIQLLPLAQLKYAFENGFIDGDTLYFNNTVLTKAALLSNWIIPVHQSWLKNRMPSNSPKLQ